MAADIAVPPHPVALESDFEAAMERALRRWNGGKVASESLKEMLLKAHIARCADIEAVTAGSKQWERVRSGVGLAELDGVYLLNRLKVAASGWKGSGAAISVTDCDHRELLYVVMEHILPNTKSVQNGDKVLHHLLSMHHLDGAAFLELGKQSFVRMAQEEWGLGKWAAAKLYAEIKEFKFETI